jgi:TRAP-type C4-dicarboxylate transport system permease small subunit
VVLRALGTASALEAASALARWGVRGGGLLMLAAAGLVSFDVIMRRVFNATTGGADELSGYAFAIGSAWSFAFVTLARINVRVDALYRLFPLPLAGIMDFLSLVAMGIFAITIARYGFDVVATSWHLTARSNSSLAVPLWIPQLAWWLGLVLFVAMLALLLLRSGAVLIRGDWQALHRLAGARSAVEEAEAEAAYAHGQVAARQDEDANRPPGSPRNPGSG